MDSFPVNITDLVVVAIIILSGLFAFLRGFVRELLVLLSWVVAGIATYFGLPLLQPLIRKLITVEIIADLAAGLLIFLTVLISLSILAHIASRPIHSSDLQPLNRTLGFVFGLFRGALIVSAIWLAVDYFVPAKDWPATLKEARTMPLVRHGAEIIALAIPEKLREESNSFGALKDDPRAREATQRAFEMLVSPTTQDAAKDAPQDDPEGYRKDERTNMERLIESAQ